MAELVDALVSNTNEAIRTGSSPVRGTHKGKWKLHFPFSCHTSHHLVPCSWFRKTYLVSKKELPKVFMKEYAFKIQKTIQNDFCWLKAGMEWHDNPCCCDFSFSIFKGISFGVFEGEWQGVHFDVKCTPCCVCVKEFGYSVKKGSSTPLPSSSTSA